MKINCLLNGIVIILIVLPPVLLKRNNMVINIDGKVFAFCFYYNGNLLLLCHASYGDHWLDVKRLIRSFVEEQYSTTAIQFNYIIIRLLNSLSRIPDSLICKSPVQLSRNPIYPSKSVLLC